MEEHIMGKSVLIILLCLILFCAFLTPAFADFDTSGSCGKNLTWNFDFETRILTLSGNGAMYNYGGYEVLEELRVPWESYPVRTIVLPDGLTSIGDYGFFTRLFFENLEEDFTSVNIPSTVINIGDGAFMNHNLRTLTLPDGLLSIGESAFYGNRYMMLTNERLPAGLTEINDATFFFCKAIRNIIIPEGVTRIGGNAFAYCSSLSDVKLPESLTSIEGGAFRGCESLTSITIPSGVTFLEGGVFEGCTALEDITLPAGLLYIGTNPYSPPGNETFKGCTALRNITLPAGLVVLRLGSFEGCTSLESIKVPGIKELEHFTFKDCTNLKEATLMPGTLKISYEAFVNCTSLQSVTIPSSITVIERDAFLNCPNLSDVYYSGSRGMWDQISISGENEALLNARIHFSDPVQSFVERSYTLLLNRDGDEAGVDFWTNSLKNGNAAGADIISQFCKSPEFIGMNLSNSDIVSVIYRTMLDRAPDESGMEYWVSVLDSGVSCDHLINGFAGSEEFAGICSSYGILPGSVTVDPEEPQEPQPSQEPRDQNPLVTSFVSRCYQYALNRSADEGGLNHWAGILLNQIMTPQEVSYEFLFSEECRNMNLSDEEFIHRLYRLYMDRDADEGGLEYWISQLVGGVTRETAAQGFANSPEFSSIVQNYGLG